MKMLLAAGILCSLATGTFAYDAQVNIGGEVTTESCKINNSTTEPVSIDVPLSSINISALPSVGSWAQNTKFVVSLTDCPGAVNVVWEKFANVDESTGALINTVAGGTNAQIRVLDRSFTPINMNNDTGIAVTTTSADLPYYAQYYAKVAPVTPGKISTFGYISLYYQ
ncbi:MAG: hypothetical protein CTR55_12940 [Pseudomonas sp.]|uniref:fimbrial protein n=1 Tax=Pseudomonas sp. TaxID=306 RepID=UPI000CB008FA|nr:fimbrial protein [Pseudomonas sp.]PJI48565.1 MAG: hypothetical protein CTR55_12940 [Pseudomonas sp.]